MTDEIRASDADRQRVIDALQRHTTDGRLTLDEFTERAEVAYSARTLGELAVVTRDLPAVPEAVAVPLPSTVDHHARQLAIAFAVAVVTLIALALLLALR